MALFSFHQASHSELVTQLIGFGKENHDDLVDSFTMLVRKILENHSETRGLRTWFNWVKKNGSMYLEIGNPYRSTREPLAKPYKSLLGGDNDGPRWWQKEERPAPSRPAEQPQIFQTRRYSTLDPLEVLGQRRNPQAQRSYESSRSNNSPLRYSSPGQSSGSSVHNVLNNYFKRDSDDDKPNRNSGGGGSSLGGLLQSAAQRRFG